MRNSADLTGKRFRHLTVEGVAFAALDGSVYWRCRCDCGKSTVIRERLLLHGNQKFCSRACKLQRPAPEKPPREPKPRKPTVKGAEHKNFRHGGRSRQDENHAGRLYTIWRNMKCRCLHPQHPAYPRYGGRGIRICDEWLDFAEFQRWALSSGYTDKMTIDRIDSDGGYESSNCQWLTKSEHSAKTNFEKYHRGEK